MKRRAGSLGLIFLSVPIRLSGAATLDGKSGSEDHDSVIAPQE